MAHLLQLCITLKILKIPKNSIRNDFWTKMANFKTMSEFVHFRLDYEIVLENSSHRNGAYLFPKNVSGVEIFLRNFRLHFL